MLRTESPTLLQLRELRARLKSSGVLNAVDERLAGLIPEVAENVSPREKIVKDGVWGTISVPGRFVPILDTRLLQRQRRIRQLGLSYLVYPAVGYSRLEHALGCFHAMDLLLSSVTARSDASVSAQLDLRRRDQLLLGALLHDVGHMPFSHASERTLEMMADDLMLGPLSASQVRDDVSDAVDKSLRLADVISLLESPLGGGKSGWVKPGQHAAQFSRNQPRTVGLYVRAMYPRPGTTARSRPPRPHRAAGLSRRAQRGCQSLLFRAEPSVLPTAGLDFPCSAPASGSLDRWNPANGPAHRASASPPSGLARRPRAETADGFRSLRPPLMRPGPEVLL